MALAGWTYTKAIIIKGASGVGTGYQVLLKIAQNHSIWQSNYSYSQGDIVKPTSGSDSFFYVCTIAGTSGSGEPTWPTNDGDNVTDGSVTWVAYAGFSLDGCSANFPLYTDDGGDLRFTDISNNLLPFYVQKVEESGSNKIAYVWVKVSANLDTNQTIYCYYGNPDATNSSDMEATFDDYWDFEDNSLDGWSFSGDKGWEISSTCHSGHYGAQNQDIDDNQTACMYRNITVDSDSKISFWWKVSSEENYDFLHFYIDGDEQAKISGEVDWQQKEFDIPAGTHEIKWCYIKDVSTSRGADTVYVDDIIIRKYVNPEPTFLKACYLSKLSGTVCDKNGNSITGVVVDIAFLKKDTKELLHTCQSNSNDGTWVDDQIPVDPSTKVLAVFSLEGSYNGDTDIAGAEFTTTEQT